RDFHVTGVQTCALPILPFQYNMLIARMEPENNVEMILDGVVASGSEQPFLVVGKTENHFGRYLQQKFRAYPQIRFMGGIFDMARSEVRRVGRGGGAGGR